MNIIKYIIEHSKGYKIYLLGIFIATIINILDSLIKPLIIKQLIDAASGEVIHDLWLLAFISAIIQLAVVCIAWPLEDYCTVRYNILTGITIIKDCMNKLYKYQYRFFQNNLTGNITSKVSELSQSAPGLILTIIEEFIPLFLMILFSCLLLLKVHILFSVITFAWFVLFCLIIVIAIKKNIYLTKKSSEKKSIIIGLVADFISNIFSVKIFSQEKAELKKLDELKDDYFKSAINESRYVSKLYVIQGIFSSLCVIALMALLVYARTNNWGITSGDFAFVIMINFKIHSMLYKASHSFKKFIKHWGAVSQAISLFENTPQVLDHPNSYPLKIFNANIVFDEVKFNYEGNDKAIFVDKSIEINAGQKVGVVGYSGSGKSTFINLILRLWELSAGSIKISGQDISKVTQESLRDNISLIPQDPTLFHRSLMENIRYGKASASDIEVIEASIKAGADDFISELPMGYNSLVGERGIKLSGGQRQRIAIARAILKDAPILILDEATSNLDSLTESNIQKHLLEFMKNKTSLVIAHRLSTLLHMDRILVFDDGKIIEDGTHLELLNIKGLYKKLWDSQIGGFLPEKIRSNID